MQKILAHSLFVILAEPPCFARFAKSSPFIATDVSGRTNLGLAFDAFTIHFLAFSGAVLAFEDKRDSLYED